MMRRVPGILFNRLSIVGLALGTLFFVASLTPTLVPRTFVTQGALSGVSFAVGYGLGVFLRWLWTFLEFPRAPDHLLRIARPVVAILCLAAVIAVLWRVAEWQNSIRRLMNLEPLSTAHPLEVCLIAIVAATALFMLAWLFGLAVRFAARAARRVLPRRVSLVVGVAFAVLLFWSVTNGLVFHLGLNALDASFAALDQLIEPDTEQPTDPLKSGSTASLVDWGEMGRTGRAYVSLGPTAAQISAFTGRPALEPIRVYVGLGSGDTADARAALALEELKRVGGFDRKVLVVVTPTGTGWIDPAAMDTVEYLHDGDIASVALQYSYLSSPLSLIVEPERGEEAARSLFEAVYDYWTALPRDRRPRLYLHGLSLGSLNSEKSLQFFEMLGDPIDGALWSGPPYQNRIWRSIVDQRDDRSPAWLPEFHEGEFVRFMNQHGATVPPEKPWGSLRVVYLQYASDAVTFFDFRDFYREPEWLKHPRGPDVSPELKWFPAVTMLQIGLDMAVATTTPVGFGHVFAPEHYVEPWIAVTDVKGWSGEEIMRLKQHLAAEQDKAIAAPGENAYEDRGG